MIFTTNHGGADVLICPAERSSACLDARQNPSSCARLADEDIRPYVVFGDPLWFLAGCLVMGGMGFDGSFAEGFFQSACNSSSSVMGSSDAHSSSCSKSSVVWRRTPDLMSSAKTALKSPG